MIKAKFVPVALDNTVALERKDADGDLFRELLRQGNKFTGASGRIHVVTAGGKFLCAPGPNDCRDCNIAYGLKRWSELPARERESSAVPVSPVAQVDPKLPKPPAGALIVSVYQSRLDYGPRGELIRRKGFEMFGAGGDPVYLPGRDTLWLSEADGKSLVPTDPEKGKQLTVPDEVAGRIVRQTLTDNSQATGVSWSAADVRSLVMTVTVEETSAAGHRLRLDGQVTLAQDRPKAGVRYHEKVRPYCNEDPRAAARYEARMLGRLYFDARTNAFTQFDVLALGEYTGRNLNPYRTEDGQNYYVTRPYPLGVALEIARSGAVAPPYSSRYGQ